MTEALDLITRDVLVAGTTVQYAGTAGSRGGVGSGMNLNLAEIREAKRVLARSNANGWMNNAMTESDIDFMVDAFDRSLARLQEERFLG